MRRLNERTYLLRESPTRRIDAIRERIKGDIYMLSTGQPGIPPPKEVREWLANFLMEESTKLYGYTPSQGVQALREAISEDLKELGGIDVSPSQIVVVAGGQEAMFATLSAILEPGDEVVLFDPTYFGYEPLVKYMGARVVYVRSPIEKGYQPDVDELKEVVSRRTKAIVVVTPDNPTGRVLDKSVAKAIVEIAKDVDAWILVDEAYKTLVYEGEHVWFWSLDPERTISVNTFSKDPGIPGWRLGYVYAPEEVARAVKLLSEEMVYCPPSVAQQMVLYYLKNKARKRFMPYVISEYKARRDAMCEAIDKYLPEAKYVRAQGAFFMFLDLSNYLGDKSGEWFAEYLLENFRVATVPGSFFGPTHDKYIRLSFATESPARIVEGIKIMGEALKGI